ncbi:MAG: Na(+)-translocating NADH-quinone reductase subunit C [Myxococcota bacterium]
MSRNDNLYIVGFAAAVCVVCSVFVSGSAVALKDRQVKNAILDRQKNVISVSGLVDDMDSVSNAQIETLFNEKITPKLIDLKTGEVVEAGTTVSCPSGEIALDPKVYDQQKAKGDPCLGEDAEDNPAKILRVPKYGLVYEVVESGTTQAIILPVEGKGLWSTMYGFIALENDAETVKGLTFYQHGETPGLGGEIDNTKWKALWPGKKVYDGDEVALNVVKGTARDTNYEVDGLSGATLTSRGVTYLVEYWLGEQGFGQYLDTYRKGA